MEQAELVNWRSSARPGEQSLPSNRKSALKASSTRRAGASVPLWPQGQLTVRPRERRANICPPAADGTAKAPGARAPTPY
ncbi:hypothetical protein J7E95_34690, partial [Streptomyces sp. ISL-14]|nr:hypothetical protein [Streptomyces sp. ISL-14]